MSYNLALSATQRRPFGEGTSSGDRWEFEMKDLSFSDEEMGDCRICHEEDPVNKMEAPCACNGSIKPYQGGYTVPDHKPEDTRINISEIEDLYDSGASRERLLEFATAQNLLRDDPDDERATASRIRTAVSRATVLFCLLVMLLRDALSELFKGDRSFGNVVLIFLFMSVARRLHIPLFSKKRIGRSGVGNIGSKEGSTKTSMIH